MRYVVVKGVKTVTYISQLQTSEGLRACNPEYKFGDLGLRQGKLGTHTPRERNASIFEGQMPLAGAVLCPSQSS